MRIASARTLGSRAESGVSQWRPVETFETTKPAFSTLRRNSLTCASVVLICNHGTWPSQSSMPSYPAFFTSSSPCSKLQPFGIMLSPIDFFTAPPSRLPCLTELGQIAKPQGPAPRVCTESPFESDGYPRGGHGPESRQDNWQERRLPRGAKLRPDWHQMA